MRKKSVSIIVSSKGFGIKMCLLLLFVIISQVSYAIPETFDESLTVEQATGSVRGVVRDADGNPMAGVTVVVAGTTTATITDGSGTYTLNNINSTNATLVFSFYGYTTQEIAANGRSVVDVTMETDAFSIDDVVVVGYGTMRKSDVTGSISIVKGDDVLKQQSFSALHGLKGKAAGVNIFANSGMPGGKTRVIIRGIGTLQGSSDPLYIVDGVAMDPEAFNLLNPNDIERIEVLKDASSTAIYGARGANGIIMVSTKRGLRGIDTPRISYQGSVSVSSMARYIDVMNSAEWMEAFLISKENAQKYQGKDYSAGLAQGLSYWFNNPNLFKSDGTPLYDTDWQREATRTAVSHNHQLSIQQGGENSSVGAFLNYTDSQGLFLNSWMKRVNGKISYDAKPTKWLSTAINLSVNHTWANEAEEEGGHQMPRRSMLEMLPWEPVKFPDGTWGSSKMYTGDVNFESMANPVHVMTVQERLRQRTQIFGNAAFTFHLAPGLDLRTQFGVDTQNRIYREYSPNDLQNISFDQKGRARITDNRRFYWQEETYLTWNKEYDKHRINLMAGLSWQERSASENDQEINGFADNYSGYHNIDAGTNPRQPSSSYNSWSMNSYFLRAVYTYDNRYTATVTGRMDGSSRFGTNNKYAFFPSVGLAWNASNEKFLADNNTISNLKLHTSYGVTGNSEIAAYRSQALITSGTTLINGQLVPTGYPGRLENPDLKWEKSYTFDIGVELGLFNNRLNFDISYYNKQTKDLLLNRPIPYSTGFDQVMYNVGHIENQGIDLLINSTNFDNENFTWSTTLNMNYNKSKVKRLGDNNEDILTGSNFVSGNNLILRVGEPLGTFWGFRRYGIWTEADAANRDISKMPTSSIVGSAKRSESREIIGKGLPDVTGSFINNFRWKNLDLSIDFQYSLGADIMQQYKHSLQDRFGLTNGERVILTDAWSPQNPNTMIQAIRDGVSDGQSSFVDSQWVVNGDYLRLNMVQLGYTFTPMIAKKVGLSALRLFVNAENLFVIHDKAFTGYDPEGSSVGSTDTWGQNVIFFQYPKPRTFVFGVSATF